MAEEPRVAAAGEASVEPTGRTRTDWPRLVAEWKASGKSQTRFCRERGVSRFQFGQWKVKLEGRDRGGGVRLVRVKGTGVATEGAGEARELGLCVGQRYRVQIPSRFDAEALRRLLEVLESR